MTILNVETVRELTGTGSCIVLISLIVGVISFMIVGAMMDCESIVPSAIAMGIAVLCGIVCICSVFSESTHEYVEQYECVVDDTYSANELLSKYDFVEQRGNIYVLREKKTQ